LASGLKLSKSLDGAEVTAFSGWHVRAEIVRWVSDDFPGFVECRLTDASERAWSIVEKVPVVTTEHLQPDSEFPQPVLIACEIVSRDRDDAGRETSRITTSTPWGIEATDGTTSFQVFATQLTRSTGGPDAA